MIKIKKTINILILYQVNHLHSIIQIFCFIYDQNLVYKFVGNFFLINLLDFLYPERLLFVLLIHAFSISKLLISVLVLDLIHIFHDLLSVKTKEIM
jgi:hypothetical protein